MKKFREWEKGELVKMGIVVLLIILGFSARLIDHPANFAPIGAIAIFSGIYMARRIYLVVPLVALFTSDLIIGLYDWRVMLAVYTSFVLMFAVGRLVKRNKKWHTILGGTVLGSVLFFLITNAAVWAFGTMYVHNFAGLMESYAMAVPFFRNSLMGDLFYTGILVGAVELGFVGVRRLVFVRETR